MLALLLGGGASWNGPVSSDAPSDDPSFLATVQERLRTRIEAERRGLDALALTRADQTVMDFYQQRGFAAAWVDDDGPRPATGDLVMALREASAHGLRPADYHVAAVDSLRARLAVDAERGTLDPRTVADFELMCTDAFLLYGDHLLTGRTTPTTITPTWNLTGRRADMIDVLNGALSAGTVQTSLTELAPPQPAYQTLQRALKRYRSIADAGGWAPVPDGPSLEEGASGPRVAALRRRLAASGDWAPEAAVEASDSTATFDLSLQAAVERFQDRHGLDADGVVGAATRTALNVPAEARARQIEATLERWRWLPNDLGARHLLVNVAAYRLSVVEQGEEVLSMRVIAGKPYRQTPVFTGEMSYLVLNPYWHVPHTIATEDKLPAFQQDPAALSRQGFEIFRGWGADAAPVDPATIDWTALSASTFPYRLRQKPGPNNALGRIKFMFPNPHSVYLHDTPTRTLFAKAERSFSSGCIRLERPIELAEYLLAGDPRWTPERLQDALKTDDAERTVLLPTRIPVHLLYWTAWADDGVVSFRSDVYDRDRELLSALDQAPPSPSRDAAAR